MIELRRHFGSQTADKKDGSPIAEPQAQINQQPIQDALIIWEVNVTAT